MVILTRLWIVTQIIVLCISSLLLSACASQEMIKAENQIEDSASPLLPALLQDGDFGADSTVFTRDVSQAARAPKPENHNLLEEASVDISARLGEEHYFTILHQGILRFQDEPSVNDMEEVMGFYQLNDVDSFSVSLPAYGRATHVSCGIDPDKANKICRVSVAYQHISETLTILIAEGAITNERMQEIVAGLLAITDSRLSQIDQ